MTRRQELVRGALAVVVFVGALVVISRCQGKGWEARTAAILKANDSLRVVVRFRDSLSFAAETRADAAVIERIAAQDSARRAIAEANRLRALRPVIRPVASQPGSAPNVSDSLRAAEAQLENCELETTSLRVAHERDSTALEKSAVTEAGLRGSLALTRGNLADVTRQNADLTRQLESAEPPCRILFFPCPTRTQATVAGVVAGAVGTLLVVSVTR